MKGARSLGGDPAAAAKMTWLALLASAGTLVCCALPILLVSLGMGAAVAALVSAAPFLVWLSQHKVWVFGLSFLVLALSGWLIHRRGGRRCPPDPALAAACERMRRGNRRVWRVSAAIWAVGFFAAYLLLPLRRWLEGAGG